MPLSPPQPPYSLDSLVQIMRDLRDPVHGCAWDLEQNFATIAPYTVEEAYEVADAIARGATGELPGELGDLLLQTVYHSQIAADAGLFAMDDVIASICTKMIARHPHVYGDAAIADAGAQTQAWEARKAEERARAGATSALDGVAIALPALTRAGKLQKRAARVGFDWPDADGPRAKIIEELAEVDAATDDEAKAAEIGDLLFSVVNWARHLGIDPEQALAAANRRFAARFRAMEAMAGGTIAGRSLDEMEALWLAAKAGERQTGR